MTLKTAVVAPMPSANETMAVSASPGRFLHSRQENRRSWRRVRMARSLPQKTQKQAREQGTAQRIIRRSTAGTSQACASPGSKCFAIFNLREGSNPSLGSCARSRTSPSQERTRTPAADAVSGGALNGGGDVASGNDIDLQHGIGRWHIGSC